MKIKLQNAQVDVWA